MQADVVVCVCSLIVVCLKMAELQEIRDPDFLEAYSLQLQGMGHLAHCVPQAVLITRIHASTGFARHGCERLRFTARQPAYIPMH